MTSSVATPSEIHAAVDRVVTTHGVYIPVELLLAMRQLRYIDYDAWRCGNRPSLQSILTGNPQHVAELLKEAADWALTLGLQPDVRDYFGWEDNAGNRLAYFQENRREEDTLLATHYVRRNEPAAGDQLDLFLDNSVTVALQAMRAALRARAPEAASRCLATLDSLVPDHRLRPVTLRLIDALTDLSNPIALDQTQTELAAIEQGLSSAARDVLGSHASDLMVAFWKRLADALSGVPFDPEQPTLHASHACIHCLDWCRAIASIEAVVDYTDSPVLLARLAQARYYNGEYNAAIAAWCMLCWSCADNAETVLDEIPPSATRLRRIWCGFCDLDRDPVPDTGLFPAYLLLIEPGLAHGIPLYLAAGGGSGRHAFDAVCRLLQQDSIETRKAVGESAPWLLALYLDQRTAF